METGLASDIFNRKLTAVFVAEYGFMLRSVIHENPLYFLHSGNDENIGYKYHHSDYALKKRFKTVKRNIFKRAVYKVNYSCGEIHKQEKGYSETDNRRNAGQNRHHLGAEMVGKPTVNAGHLLLGLLRIVKSGLFGRLHKALITEYHRLHKGDNASEERYTEYFVFLFYMLELLGLC